MHTQLSKQGVHPYHGHSSCNAPHHTTATYGIRSRKCQAKRSIWLKDKDAVLADRKDSQVTPAVQSNFELGEQASNFED